MVDAACWFCSATLRRSQFPHGPALATINELHSVIARLADLHRPDSLAGFGPLAGLRGEFPFAKLFHPVEPFSSPRPAPRQTRRATWPEYSERCRAFHPPWRALELHGDDRGRAVRRRGGHLEFRPCACCVHFTGAPLPTIAALAISRLQARQEQPASVGQSNTTSWSVLLCVVNVAHGSAWPHGEGPAA